MQIMSYTDSI